MGIFDFFVGIFVFIQTLCSAAMCLWGYKWSKKLIAITSGYIGLFIGIFLFSLYFSTSGDAEGIFLIPICVIIFMGLAYKSVSLNQFCVGFLLVLKVSYVFLSASMDSGLIEWDINDLLGGPVLLGILGGIIIFKKLKNGVIISCLAFIGASEIVPKLMSFIDGTLFVATGDISFIFDPIEYVLDKFGIETVSFLEVAFIIIVFIFSYRRQKNKALAMGINLNSRDIMLDDREYSAQ